jgi:hypothetical protein
VIAGNHHDADTRSVAPFHGSGDSWSNRIGQTPKAQEPEGEVVLFAGQSLLTVDALGDPQHSESILSHRCRLNGEAIDAAGFDYIEYPKLLTQPEADAPQRIKEALEQFLSWNQVKGDKVVISVSGESGLAR